MNFLPVSYQDMKNRGWNYVDFVFVNGDAYVDHPSFGVAIISRVLENNGFKIGIISQPDWKNSSSISIFGKPRLGFLVSSGNMDSMVNHYTVAKKKRNFDAYSNEGKIGLRPDRAVIVYSNLIRQTFKDSPIILGGLEASLRRLAHYDYWSNSLKHSVLLDSGADLLVYGMGEKAILQIANSLNNNTNINNLTNIKGTVFKTKSVEGIKGVVNLPSFDSLKENKKKYADSFIAQLNNNNSVLSEKYKDFYVVQNPPQPPLSTEELDKIYELPYARNFHPSYSFVPAIEEVKFSLTSVRGCFGACNFCAISFHQGTVVQARSHQSILKEAQILASMPDFKGYIHDVGGPTANFRSPSCDKQVKFGSCNNKKCLFPSPCSNLKVDHQDYVSLLTKLRHIKGVKKVFIRSGIRFDYLVADKNKAFLKNLCEFHISGQLKVAPEHISNNVLFYMGKPNSSVYLKFVDAYNKMNSSLNKKQFLVPYLMSSHPGSTLKDAIELAEYIKNTGHNPEQVQDFYPTPSTISTCMFYTHIDPRTSKPVYVADNPKEKAMQRALIQFNNPKNYRLVEEALVKANRTDLIGFKKQCLIRPRERFHSNSNLKGKNTFKRGKHSP